MFENMPEDYKTDKRLICGAEEDDIEKPENDTGGKENCHNSRSRRIKDIVKNFFKCSKSTKKSLNEINERKGKNVKVLTKTLCQNVKQKPLETSNLTVNNILSINVNDDCENNGQCLIGNGREENSRLVDKHDLVTMNGQVSDENEKFIRLGTKARECSKNEQDDNTSDVFFEEVNIKMRRSSLSGPETTSGRIEAQFIESVSR